MNRCTNSFPLSGPFARIAILIAVTALPAVAAYAQAGPSQKVSPTTARPCIVETSGEVTYLVKNGVELSVTEDWDCDGQPDAYDNCVGMPNATQADTDGNGIGDVCETATIVRAGVPSKTRSTAKATAPKASAKTRSTARAKTSKKKEVARNRSNTKAKPRQAKTADKRPRSSGKRPRNS